MAAETHISIKRNFYGADRPIRPTEYCVNTVADPGFSRGGGVNPPGGA